MCAHARAYVSREEGGTRNFLRLEGLNLNEFEIDSNLIIVCVCVLSVYRLKMDRTGNRVSESLNVNEFEILLILLKLIV